MFVYLGCVGVLQFVSTVENKLCAFVYEYIYIWKGTCFV